MNLRSIPRAAVGGYVKAVRWPLDRVLGRNAEPAIDRAEAAAREVAGTALGDDELKTDAKLRRTAADQRERAQTLDEQAGQRRAEARDQAQARKREADRKRAAEKRAATRAEQQRKQAAERAAAQTEAALDERAKRERLQQLDREAEALAEREEAVTARDEANRLAGAAASAKADRKS
jgi:hypothetical protein